MIISFLCLQKVHREDSLHCNTVVDFYNYYSQYHCDKLVLGVCIWLDRRRRCIYIYVCLLCYIVYYYAALGSYSLLFVVHILFLRRFQ